MAQDNKRSKFVESAWVYVKRGLTMCEDFKGKGVRENIDNIFGLLSNVIVTSPLIEIITKMAANHIPDEHLTTRNVLSMVVIIYLLVVYTFVKVCFYKQVMMALALYYITEDLTFVYLLPVGIIGTMFRGKGYPGDSVVGPASGVAERLSVLAVLIFSAAYMTGQISVMMFLSCAVTTIAGIAMLQLPSAIAKKSNDYTKMIIGILGICAISMTGLVLAQVERWQVMLVLTGKAMKYSTKSWDELFVLRGRLEDKMFQAELDEIDRYQAMPQFTVQATGDDIYLFMLRQLLAFVMIYKWCAITYNTGIGPLWLKSAGERREIMLLSTGRNLAEVDEASNNNSLTWIVRGLSLAPIWVLMEATEHFVSTMLHSDYAMTGFHVGFTVGSVILSSWLWKRSVGVAWEEHGTNCHRTQKNIQGQHMTGPGNGSTMLRPTLNTEKRTIVFATAGLLAIMLYKTTGWEFVRTVMSLMAGLAMYLAYEIDTSDDDTKLIMCMGTLAAKVSTSSLAVLNWFKGSPLKMQYSATFVNNVHIIPLEPS